MRIAIAHDSVETTGGVETYLTLMIGRLRERGHDVALVYFTRAKGVTELRRSTSTTFGIEEQGSASAFESLSRWQPDVVVSHNMGPLEVDRQLLARWSVVKMLHGYFGTCISGLKMHAFPSPTACSRTFGPACLALYIPRRCGPLSLSAMAHGYRWSTAQRALFGRYAAIVVASQHMRDEVARHGISQQHVNVLPLFPTLTSTTHRGCPPAEPDTVLFAGRMTSLKGGDLLLSAAASAARKLGRPVRVVMAGDGPQRGEWRHHAAALRVPLEETGWVSGEERTRVFARCSLVAVPSLWPEPFGLSGLDAASLGRPAVAFDVGGISDWLFDGRNGILVDPEQGAEGMAQAIAALLGDPAQLERMGSQARAVAERMSLDAHLDALEQILRAASKRARAPQAEDSHAS